MPPKGPAQTEMSKNNSRGGSTHDASSFALEEIEDSVEIDQADSIL